VSARAPLTRRVVRLVDQRTGSAPYLRKAMRYLFPDHWSFLLGEIALYAFIVLVATGIYLTFFFVDSTREITYHGHYAPLYGQKVSEAYASVLNISFRVRAGLLIRQTHHWAADVFIGAIVLHLFRVFFTGAYRKPRELTYLIGVTMLMLTLLEAYIGYSMVDDLMSGMGLVIGYSVGLSLPFVGQNLMNWLFNGMFPGSTDFWPRMYIAHVLIFPLLIGGLLTAHLVLVMLKHHTQFKRRRAQTEHALMGVPAWPGQAPRSIGLALATVGVLFLLGGLVEINPIWLWGPFHTYASTNGAQPDWYLGWLIGGLRLVPSFDLVIDGYTLVPNPFWGGAALPLIVFGFLYLWPWLERRFTRDYAFHNVLERPRDAPVRTGFGVAIVTWVTVVFLAGSADRVAVIWNVSYVGQIHVYWVMVWVLPVLFGLIAWWACKELQASEKVVRRRREAEAQARLARMRRGGANPEPPGEPSAAEPSTGP
jgi:quinol---cytochrome-c reductase cytochrome b subunit